VRTEVLYVRSGWANIGVPVNQGDGETTFAPSRIITANCVAGMRKYLEPRSVDVIVTSPPYNLGKQYVRYDDSREPADYLRWLHRVSLACKRVLSDDGSFFLNLGSKPSNPWWPMEALSVFRREFRLQNTILWVKSIAIMKADVGRQAGVESDMAFGHYKPVHSSRFVNGMSEYVFHLTRRGDVSLDKLAVGVPYQDKSNVVRWGGTDLRDRGNVWFIPYDTIRTKRAHPCVFPIRLPEMCIQLHGVSKTRLVMDPFLGTGTSAIASDRLDRPFIGFDIDKVYTAMAKQRLIDQRAARVESVAVNGPIETAPWMGISFVP
jgi:site-specific DNA-methyltransferase (adenine-specific)